MAISAQSIILRAATIINDKSGVWSQTNELVRWLNDGQREVVIYRPDATATPSTMTCVEGTRQTLPAGGKKLMSVVRNATGTKKPIRLVDMSAMDGFYPGWHSRPTAAEIQNYMFDSRQPDIFWVYPPAKDTCQIDIIYSAAPADITEPADGATYSSVSGNISIIDSLANALLDYIVYRAFSKESTFGNGDVALAHYKAFMAAMGVEVKGAARVEPKSAAANRSTAVQAGA